jgi:hypothetical protein
MDPKKRQDQALNLADFRIDDMLSVPGDRLLAEVAEDHGQPTHLAEAFDTIASPLLSHHDAGVVGQDSVPAILSLPHAAPDAAPLAAAAPPSPAAPSRRHGALAALAEWLAMPLRHRVALGACAALLVLAVSAPRIYMRLADRSAEPIAGPPADRIATPAKEEQSTPSPAPMPPQPEPAPNQAASLPAGPSPTLSPIPPPAPLGPEFSARRGCPPAEARQAPPPAAAASPAEAARSTAAPEAPAAAPVPAPPAQAPLQRQAAAKARPGEAGGFAVQLAAVKSEAEARATFRGLQSKYQALQGREPVIRRKVGGNGAYYTVQLGPFESQEEAAKLCGQLKTAGGSCFPTKN